MTACLYMSPPWNIDDPEDGLIPVLLADTMVTLKGLSGETIANLPAAPAVDLEKASHIKLTRKLVLIEDAAFAFAGRGDLIDQTVHEVRQQYPEWKQMERPFFNLARIAERIGIQALGVVRRAEGLLHVAPTAQARRTKHLGFCAAIGSGTQALLEAAAAADTAFDSGWDLKRTTIRDKIIGFVNALNGRRLGAELLGAKGARASWGGFFESAIGQGPGEPWIRGPDTIHFFFAAVPWNGGFTLKRLNRTICYNPGYSNGRILSLGFDAVRDWQLGNVDSAVESEARTSTGSYWGGWKPQVAVLTVADLVTGTGYMTRTLTGAEQAEFVVAACGSGSFQTGLKDEFLARFAVELPIRLRYEHTLKDAGWNGMKEVPFPES